MDVLGSELELQANKDKRFIQSVKELHNNDYETINQSLYNFLDKLAMNYEDNIKEAGS